jgi:hypothetical protein
MQEQIMTAHLNQLVAEPEFMQVPALPAHGPQQYARAGSQA